MRTMRGGTLTVALVAGCSFMAVRGPSSAIDTECSTSSTAPVVDAAMTTIIGLMAVAGVAGVATNEDSSQVDSGIRVLAGLVALVPTAVYATSAWYGFSRTGRCHANRRWIAEATWRRPPPSAPTLQPGGGEPCRGAMPGVPNTGTCAHGLVCRGRTCRRP